MKYIDADKLKAEIERLYEGEAPSHDQQCEFEDGYFTGIATISKFIDSLQQEQPGDIVVVSKTFLDALSKTPYNNKPITDAQTIVKQLLLFFENPKEYNPDAILEQPEVDLDELINDFLLNNSEFLVERDSKDVVQKLARHFYELGLNARKED